MITNIILLFGLLIGVLYLRYSFKDENEKFKIPKSISDTYYKIKIKLYFNVFIICIALPLAISGSIFMQIASIFLLFVQVAPAFKNDPEKSNKEDRIEIQLHMIGVIGWGILGVIAISIIYGFWWMGLSILLGSVLLFLIFKKKEYYATFIELWIAFCFYISEFLHHNIGIKKTIDWGYSFTSIFYSLTILFLFIELIHKQSIINSMRSLINKLYDKENSNTELPKS